MKNEVVIQLNKIELTTNSCEIMGRATFTDEPIKGVKNVAMVVISNIVFLFIWSELKILSLLLYRMLCNNPFMGPGL